MKPLTLKDKKASFLERFPSLQKEFSAAHIISQPEDRVEPKACSVCGQRFFIWFRLPNEIEVVRCFLCGSAISLPRKKSTFKRRRGSSFKSWRAEICRRYNDECAICGAREDLQLHHIIPYSVDPTLEFHENNGILLCRRCHALAHTIKNN